MDKESQTGVIDHLIPTKDAVLKAIHPWVDSIDCRVLTNKTLLEVEAWVKVISCQNEPSSPPRSSSRSPSALPVSSFLSESTKGAVAKELCGFGGCSFSSSTVYALCSASSEVRTTSAPSVLSPACSRQNKQVRFNSHVSYINHKINTDLPSADILWYQDDDYDRFEAKYLHQIHKLSAFLGSSQAGETKLKEKMKACSNRSMHRKNDHRCEAMFLSFEF